MLRSLLRWLGVTLLAFVLLTTIPVFLLRWLHPLTSAFMLEARFEAALQGARAYHTDYRWTPFERIAPEAGLAVIASEDQQFPFHAGFDVRSIRAALHEGAHGRRLRGASTISQQVAKNLFLWPGHSFLRKGLEAWITLLIEAFWPKQRILEVYLNVVQFGDGIWGVEAAAQHYFHRPASRLGAGEAALLAAVLPNPHRLRVERPSHYVLARREWILVQMRELGGVTFLRALDRPRSRTLSP